jgi:hypothetical protein
MADGDSTTEDGSGETTLRVLVDGLAKSLDKSKRGGRFAVVAVLLLSVEAARFLSKASCSL